MEKKEKGGNESRLTKCVCSTFLISLSMKGRKIQDLGVKRIGEREREGGG